MLAPGGDCAILFRHSMQYALSIGFRYQSMINRLAVIVFRYSEIVTLKFRMFDNESVNEEQNTVTVHNSWTNIASLALGS